MGFINDIQETPEGEFEAVSRHLEHTQQVYNEGKTSEINFHSQMALNYSLMKRPTECRYHALQVPDTAADEDRINAWISMARILIYEKKIGEAIEYYQKVIDLDPEHDMALEELGWCLYEEQCFAEAEDCFDRAVALEPDADWLYEAGGFAASHQEKYTVALEYFNKALAADENSERADRYEYCIGLCYEKMGDFYRALAHYTKSLDINPLNSEALNNMAALYFEHEADIKTAMNYLEKAEAIAEEQDNTQLLQLIYINLVRLNTLIVDYEAKEHYNTKLLQLLGFPVELDDDEDDDYAS